jgi:hypothetical protein
MFTTKELFSKALMIELPWFIEKMEFDQTRGKLDVWIDFARGSEFFLRIKHWESVGSSRHMTVRSRLGDI